MDTRSASEIESKGTVGKCRTWTLMLCRNDLDAGSYGMSRTRHQIGSWLQKR